jgi:hypothetical protein
MGPCAAPPVDVPPTGCPIAGPAAGLSRFPVTGPPIAGPGGFPVKGKVGAATATPAMAANAAASRSSLKARVDQKLMRNSDRGHRASFV